MSEPRPQSPQPKRVLCLGEALVDLVCERPLARLSDAGSFVPHFGGVVANVAALVARAGVPVTLVGGAGDDEWGAWLRQRLVDEGVDVSLFRLIEGRQTPLALVAIDAAGEPRYEIYGEQTGTITAALPDGVDAAVEQSGALFISSNTLVGADERELTMRARDRALGLGRPVIFDPNLRLHRWRSRADAAASANACVPGALLVRCNEDEAALLTGEEDVERAALALSKAGARLVAITRGDRGALLRGEMRADAGGVPVQVRSTIGAGDTFMAFLLARLAQSGFYPSVVATGLREAVARGAHACERWGALD